MDESKLYSHRSFYISLQDQLNAISASEVIARRPGHRVPKDRTTRIHFAAQHDQHWAAIQVFITPFGIKAIPNQTFFSCRFRYTLCCQTALGADNSSELLDAVQRIYDVYFQPTQWDFSSKCWYVLGSSSPGLQLTSHSRTYDPPVSGCPDVSCVKKAELALLGYIKSENDAEIEVKVLGSSGVEDACDRPANRLKRRRLNTAHSVYTERDLNGDDDNDQECSNDEGSKGDENYERADEDRGSSVGIDTRGNEVGVGEDEAVKSLMSKIMKGLDKLSRATKEGKSTQPTCTDVAVPGSEFCPTDIVPMDFNARFACGEYNIKDRSLCLENILWEQASRVLRSASQISWKCRIVAACLRKFRDLAPTACDVRGRSPSTRTRWVLAASAVNAIVDGLWRVWGPQAALVYEALSCKSTSSIDPL